jgi:hypothetical protein
LDNFSFPFFRPGPGEALSLRVQGFPTVRYPAAENQDGNDTKMYRNSLEDQRFCVSSVMPFSLKELARLKLMKTGDYVYLVSDPLTIGGGIAGVITALYKTTADVQTSLRSQVLTVMAADLLPAKLYTQAILRGVFDALQRIEKEDGSILNLRPSELVEKLVKQDLNRQTAIQCAELFDATEWKISKLPFYRWVERIKNYYYREDRLPKPEPTRLQKEGSEPVEVCKKYRLEEVPQNA